MNPSLTATEARIIGCLIEKSITTPDQYPLTLNSLLNACNQKSSRNPVMNLQQGEVEHALRTLADKHFVMVAENFKRGVDKYTHRFCNTRYSEWQFDAAELAIVCLLLLRGPQTSGELRSRSGRLHRFEDNADAVAALTRLIDREGGALLVKLPRTPGRKDSEYMHLFCGDVDVKAHAEDAARTKPESRPQSASRAALEERVSRLEEAVKELQDKLQDGN